jgi:hypothetical protein
MTKRVLTLNWHSGCDPESMVVVSTPGISTAAPNGVRAHDVALALAANGLGGSRTQLRGLRVVNTSEFLTETFI